MLNKSALFTNRSNKKLLMQIYYVYQCNSYNAPEKVLGSNPETKLNLIYVLVHKLSIESCPHNSSV